MGDTPLQIRFGAVDADKIISALDRIEKSVTGMASKTDEEAKKVDKTFSDLGNKMAKGVAAIGIAVAGAASTAAIGIWKIVSSSSDMISEFDKMSQKTGIAIESLQGLQYAAKMADVDFSEMSVGLKFLAKNAADFSKGTGDAVVAFKSLGVSAVDATGKLKPTDQLLLELADKFSRLKDGPDKAALALDIFGRSGTEMIPVLNMGAKGIAEYTGKFKDFGEVIGGGLLQKNEEFERVTKNLSTALTGIKLSLASELFPIVTKYIDKIDEWIVKNKELISSDVGGALDKIAKALPSAEQMISVLDNAVKALKYVADNINGIILVAKTAAEIMATIWVTTKLNNYSAALNTFAAGMETSGVKTIVLKGIISDLGWVINKAIPLLAAFIVGWEIGKAIGEWKIFGKVIDDLVAAREKDGDISRQTAKQEAATVEMLNQKYNQHFKSLAEWNTYLDGKKKESATKQVEIVKKQTEEELKLKKSLTAEELKEIQKYIDDEKKLRGDAYDKLKEQWKQELIQYGKTAEGKAVVDEKFFKLTEALVLADEKKTGDAEWAKVEEKRKANDAAFAYRQKKLAEEDALYASQIQKEIETDISAGNIFVNNTDEYLGRIYELDNISYEERQKLLDLALGIQKAKYENFVNKLNTIMGKVQGVVAGIDVAIKGDVLGGIQQVAAQLGPEGQAVAGIIEIGKTLKSIFSEDAYMEEWRKMVKNLDYINAVFANTIDSMMRKVAGMDSVTNEYLSTIDTFNTALGQITNLDTAMIDDLNTGYKLFEDYSGKVIKHEWRKAFGTEPIVDEGGKTTETWGVKVAEHYKHFEQLQSDLQEVQKAGIKVYEDQINVLQESIDAFESFAESITDSVTEVGRTFDTSAELVAHYGEDITALGEELKGAVGAEDQVAILDEIKSKILARYEEQIKIINDAQSAIDDLTKSMADFATSISDSITNIMRMGFTAEENITATQGDIAQLNAELLATTDPEARIAILEKLKKAEEDLFNLQFSHSKELRDAEQSKYDAAKKQIDDLAKQKLETEKEYTTKEAEITASSMSIAEKVAAIAQLKTDTDTKLANIEAQRIAADLVMTTSLPLITQYNADMVTVQNNAVTALGTIQTEANKAYGTMITQNQAIIDGLGGLTGVQNKTLSDLSDLQTTTNDLLEPLEGKLFDVNTKLDTFNTSMSDALLALENIMLYPYATGTDITNLGILINKAMGIPTTTTPPVPTNMASNVRSTIAGLASHEFGGPVTRTGIVEPKYDAFVITHKMLNQVSTPEFNIPKFNIPAPVVNVNVPGQKGMSATNITLNGTFLPGDAARLISELLYDSSRAGAGRLQNFNRQKFGNSKINMRNA